MGGANTPSAVILGRDPRWGKWILQIRRITGRDARAQCVDACRTQSNRKSVGAVFDLIIDWRFMMSIQSVICLFVRQLQSHGRSPRGGKNFGRKVQELASKCLPFSRVLGDEVDRLSDGITKACQWSRVGLDTGPSQREHDGGQPCRITSKTRDMTSCSSSTLRRNRRSCACFLPPGFGQRPILLPASWTLDRRHGESRLHDPVTNPLHARIFFSVAMPL
jgi:hypothetical protein